MPAQRFLIAPYNESSGLTQNVRPWQIPDNAFSKLQNAYVFRGRVRKRPGSKWMDNSVLKSRLRVNIGTIPSMSPQTLTLTANITLTTQWAIGQQFSVGTNIYTITQLGMNVDTLSTNYPTTTATIDSTASNNTITFSGETSGATVYWYPALPVMALPNIETSVVNNEPLLGFDTQFAYQFFTGSGWQQLSEEATFSGESVWSGTNLNYFQSCTWSGSDPADLVFYVTNFNENEYMRWFEVSTSTWNFFQPVVGPGPTYINSARLIVVFKNRLVLLNTWEGTSFPGTPYVGRARWSWIGNATSASAFSPTSLGASGADAPTTEAIIGCEFLKDRLIVMFEKSTWELVYNGNQATPFYWQKINTELGSESTFSTIPFDKYTLAIGSTGIHACNGANVERIDTKIPEEIFQIENDYSGPERVYGIRDYYEELVYWSFYSQEDQEYNPSLFPYNNQVLLYNYQNNTWSLLDDSITVFGYYQPTIGLLWNSETVIWDSDELWGETSSQSLFRQVIGGNQEGYTFIFDEEQNANAAVLQITNITTSGTQTQLTIVDHNLPDGSYIYLQDIVWSDASNNLNNTIYKVTTIEDDSGHEDPDNVLISSAAFTGTYLGGGLAARVSQIDIITKQFNFFAEKFRNVYVSKVDFMVDTTAAGQLTVNYYNSSSTQSPTQESIYNGTILGTATLNTFPYIADNYYLGVRVFFEYEANQERVWHPVYFQAEGEVVSFEITMNDAQMRNVNIMPCDFQMHAMAITAEPTSDRFQ